jgi:hypothetical protein
MVVPPTNSPLSHFRIPLYESAGILQVFFRKIRFSLADLRKLQYNVGKETIGRLKAMEHKADHIVQNVGAIAETTSVFYNTIAKLVPKDAALVLTQHFMDLTISRRPSSADIAAAIAAAKAAETQLRNQKKREAEQSPQPPAQPEPPQDSSEENS